MRKILSVLLLGLNLISQAYNISEDTISIDLITNSYNPNLLFYYDSLNVENIHSINSKLKPFDLSNAIGSTNSRLVCTWYKFKVTNLTNNSLVFEARDPNIFMLDLYLIKNNLKDTLVIRNGKAFSFEHRLYKSPQLIYELPISKGEYGIIYLKVTSKRNYNPHFVIDTNSRIFNRLIPENIVYGLILGIIIFAIINNLIIFFSIRDKLYFYFVLYLITALILSVNHFYIDLIIFNHFPINGYLIEISCFIVYVVSLHFYVNGFLESDTKHQRISVILSIVFISISIHESIVLGYSYSLPYLLVVILFYYLVISIQYLKKGNRSIVYLILGLSAVLIGQLFFLSMIYFPKPGFVLYLTFYFGLVLDIIFFSLGLGDRYRMLKEQKDQLSQEIIAQLKFNQELKDNINKELAGLVKERTKELEIANEEIRRMNSILELDKEKLYKDIKEISEARVMQKLMSFDEFKKIYKDDDACYKFLSELKWKDGYVCNKCGNERFAAGAFPHSRRCVRCNYTESPMVNTVFEGVRFELSKAFYLLYNIYASKRKVSSTEMATLLNMRQKTCWAFINKIEELLEKKKLTKRTNNAFGWTTWIINSKT